MTREEAKFRVRLDTSQAKAELKGMTREAEREAGKTSFSIRNAVKRGMGLIGVGAAIGTGISTVRAASQSGLGDIIGESLSSVGANLAQFLFGTLDEDARASKAAREETIQAFGAVAGRNNAIPPGAEAYYAQVKGLRLQEEKGRQLFEQDTSGRFHGPGVDDLLARIMTGIGEELMKAAKFILEGLLTFWK